MSTFQYVFLPADSSLPPEVRTASTQGGLQDDELLKTAKKTFAPPSNLQNAIAQASPEQRKSLVERFRKGQPNFAHLPDEQILAVLQATASGATTSCDILALTVPTPANGYQAVSMYIPTQPTGNDDKASAETPPMVMNERATNLVRACGYTLPPANPFIYGDVFVGRAYDNEAEEWKRMDFLQGDLDIASDWIQRSRASGGGGGTGSSAPSSLSKVFSSLPNSTTGADTTPELGYALDQTEDEVEIVFIIDGKTKAKDVKVVFGKDHLKVQVLGETLVDGPTFGGIRVDECTYTLQDGEKAGTRELVVTLGKRDSTSWLKAVQ
eukprot:Nitzschia sp. Nitz4//scaffold198_size39746//75//1046//NITZ4_007595-RA/size39746-processed-gene-0.30-mRNA-1//1//CDS//3329540500//4997//frame0